jgi:uncharacterized membrane protein
MRINSASRHPDVGDESHAGRTEPLNVLIAGESSLTETLHIRGADHFTVNGYVEGAKWLIEAIDDDSHTVTYQPNHVALEEFPNTAEGLGAFDVVILSDIGATTLLFESHRTPGTYEPQVDRLTLIREYVRSGGGLLMIGGYLSFQGIDGRARYRGTPVEDALPVIMMNDGDDRVEAPHGLLIRAESAALGHPILEGLPHEFPPALFCNRLHAKDGAEVILWAGELPILTVWDFGAGRSAAFAADAAPHGAPPEFLEWEYFSRFWKQVVAWLGRRDGCGTNGHPARVPLRRSAPKPVVEQEAAG